ncbi:MAG: hypothetical protein OXQ89_15885 [Rhodospirillaceae bacterium]|nr:hypothetical protein [Rhodospirillaceae bacterium]
MTDGIQRWMNEPATGIRLETRVPQKVRVSQTGSHFFEVALVGPSHSPESLWPVQNVAATYETRFCKRCRQDAYLRRQRYRILDTAQGPIVPTPLLCRWHRRARACDTHGVENLLFRGVSELRGGGNGTKGLKRSKTPDFRKAIN